MTSTQSILCETEEMYSQEMIGQRFGDYTVTSLVVYVDSKKRKHTQVSCTHGTHFCALNNLYTIKHGCIKCRRKSPIPDDHHKRLDGIYKQMIDRCYNPKNISYKNYRHIGVYEPWRLDRNLFLVYVFSLPNYGPTMSIDRIDNDKGYEPGNLRWATRSEQVSNTRRTLKVTWNDEELAFKFFVEKYCKAPYCTVKDHYKRGVPLHELVKLEPKHKISRAKVSIKVEE